MLIMYRTVTGVEEGADGVFGTGNNDSAVFVPKTGRGRLGFSFVKASITSFVANLQQLLDDNATWLDVRDASGAAVSLFGTVSASMDRVYPLWFGGAWIASGVQHRVRVTVTGTPATTDAIRMNYDEAA